MLNYLIIHNFAIIDKLELELFNGFTAITGETGAGKSIIINALNLVLGSRTNADVIRAESDRASVEAHFALSSFHQNRISPILEAQGIENSDELIVRRIVRRSGDAGSRSQAFINGSMVNLQTLREVARGLVEISGQHEHYTLLAPENHRGILDRFADLEAQGRQVAAGVRKLRKLRNEARRLRESERERLARVDYLTFQLNEISRALLDPQERKELEKERDLLQHAETLRDETTQTSNALYEGDQSICDVLGDISGRLTRLVEFDARLTPLVEVLENTHIQLGEVGRELSQYSDGIDVDPKRLEEVEQLLYEYDQLERKYGDSFESITTHETNMRTELQQLRSVENRIDQADAEHNKLQQSLMAEARTLSLRRKNAASHLRQRIEEELQHLNMGRCQFLPTIQHRNQDGEVIEELEQVGPDALHEGGLDHVEYLICPNPGEGFKALARVASGGELSRIMLAIKNVLMSTDPTPTLIFDEVDTGIGGITADVVGEKIQQISHDKQVLCITHLPHIAAYGTQQLLVEKRQEDNKTTSNLRLLNDEQRIHEIARMLSGRNASEKTLAHAHEMIVKSAARA